MASDIILRRYGATDQLRSRSARNLRYAGFKLDDLPIARVMRP